jgi:hypothetical protein
LTKVVFNVADWHCDFIDLRCRGSRINDYSIPNSEAHSTLQCDFLGPFCAPLTRKCCSQDIGTGCGSLRGTSSALATAASSYVGNTDQEVLLVALCAIGCTIGRARSSCGWCTIVTCTDCYGGCGGSDLQIARRLLRRTASLRVWYSDGTTFFGVTTSVAVSGTAQETTRLSTACDPILVRDAIVACTIEDIHIGFDGGSCCDGGCRCC